MVIDKFSPKVVRKVCDVMRQWCGLAITFRPSDKGMPLHFARIIIFSRNPFFAGVNLIICLPFDPVCTSVTNTIAKNSFGEPLRVLTIRAAIVDTFPLITSLAFFLWA